MQAAVGRRTFWFEHQWFTELGKSTGYKFERCSYAKGICYITIIIIFGAKGIRYLVLAYSLWSNLKDFFCTFTESTIFAGAIIKRWNTRTKQEGQSAN